MAVTEYIGMRYVPRFAEPAEWSSTREYEHLTIVLHNGNSFTSKKAVPMGIDIDNPEYWAETGNYNAQIEAYRDEVLRFDGRITGVEGDVGTLRTDLQAEANAREQADTGLQQSIGQETSAREQADTALQQSIGQETSAREQADIAINAKFPVQTDNIGNQAVTHAKLAENAVTSINIADGAIGLVDLNENVQSRILNENVRYSNIVFIGDSYGRGVGGTDGQGWPYYCVQALAPAAYVNVSNSGAGFIAQGHSSGLSGMTFSDQLDYASEHLPANVAASQVDYVVIAGGYNDHAQSGISAAVFSTARHAKSLFPNARIMVLPLAAPDVELNAEFNSAYHSIVNGATLAGAETSENSLYWLYPYELQAKYGDNIHPNNEGYQIIGRMISSFILGGDVSAYASVLGASAEGYATADSATSNGFRCGVNNGMAWASGSFIRTGVGDLCTLPSYLRPLKTTYALGFAYADPTHHGVARLRVLTNGNMDFLSQESGEYDSSLQYTIWLPYICIQLGHTWQ